LDGRRSEKKLLKNSELRIIKLGIISIIFFSLLLTGFSLFFPSHVRISKAIDINADTRVVMQQLSDSYNWKNWYPGADSAAGLPVITAVTDTSVLATTTIMNGRKGITGWNLYPAAIPNTVTVQWYMDFHLGWLPWEKFSSLLLEKRYGVMMENGLTNLKKLVEK
jgi:hypothetical protein